MWTEERVTQIAHIHIILVYAKCIGRYISRECNLEEKRSLIYLTANTYAQIELHN